MRGCRSCSRRRCPPRSHPRGPGRRAARRARVDGAGPRRTHVHRCRRTQPDVVVGRRRARGGRDRRRPVARRASAEALVFAARRVKAEAVAMVFAVNDDVESLATEGLPQLSVRGLADADAAALLRSRTPLVADTVVAHLVSATGGNPLFLVQLPTTLSREQLTGQEPVPHPLPVGQRLSEWYATKLQGLSTDGRRAVVLAAASDTGAWACSRRLPNGTMMHSWRPRTLDSSLSTTVAFASHTQSSVLPSTRSIARERRAAHRRQPSCSRPNRGTRNDERGTSPLRRPGPTTRWRPRSRRLLRQLPHDARMSPPPPCSAGGGADERSEYPRQMLTDAAWSYRLAGRGERAQLPGRDRRFR